jgi:hypothetical protein
VGVADGTANNDELIVAHDAAGVVLNGPDQLIAAIEAAEYAAHSPNDVYDGQYYALHVAYDTNYAVGETSAEREAQCMILRDLVGNPFRPITPYAEWLSMTVTRLAETIYTDRTFDRLPILADALEETGCDNADILNHCRQPGEHVRGCWVVDLILGKS